MKGKSGYDIFLMPGSKGDVKVVWCFLDGVGVYVQEGNWTADDLAFCFDLQDGKGLSLSYRGERVAADAIIPIWPHHGPQLWTVP